MSWKCDKSQPCNEDVHQYGLWRIWNSFNPSEDSGRQEVSLQFRLSIFYVYSGVHLENSVIVLKFLLELTKLYHHVMNVQLSCFNNFTLHLGVADSIITLWLSMQCSKKVENVMMNLMSWWWTRYFPFQIGEIRGGGVIVG